MLTRTLAALAIFIGGTAQAETIRYDFNTAADLSQSFYGNSISQNSAGSFPGVITTTTGVDSTVVGFVEIDNSSGTDIITDFFFDITVPYGVPTGFIDQYGSAHVRDQQTETQVSLANGGSAVFGPGGRINLSQSFQFVANHGPNAFPAQVNPFYDPSDFSLATFRLSANLAPLAGAGLNGASGYEVVNTLVNCFEPGSSPVRCNGHYGTNLGRWNAGSGVGTASLANGTPSAVPLPAGLPMLFVAMGLLAFLRRRA